MGYTTEEPWLNPRQGYRYFPSSVTRPAFAPIQFPIDGIRDSFSGAKATEA